MRRRNTLITIIAAVAGLCLASCGKKMPEIPGIPSEITGLGDMLKGATEKLTAITGSAGDPAKALESATAALPDLTNVSTQLSGLSGKLSSLPGPAKDMLTKVIGEFGDKIIALLGQAQAIPGVGDKLGPIAKIIIEHITKLKGA